MPPPFCFCCGLASSLSGQNPPQSKSSGIARARGGIAGMAQLVMVKNGRIAGIFSGERAIFLRTPAPLALGLSLGLRHVLAVVRPCVRALGALQIGRAHV